MLQDTADIEATSERQSTNVAKPPKRNRSRLRNGGWFSNDADWRSAEARRFKEIFSKIVSDLGGADTLSEGQLQLARRAAFLCVQCESIEDQATDGKEIDLEAWARRSLWAHVKERCSRALIEQY